jgi:hypothetical protein
MEGFPFADRPGLLKAWANMTPVARDSYLNAPRPAGDSSRKYEDSSSWAGRLGVMAYKYNTGVMATQAIVNSAYVDTVDPDYKPDQDSYVTRNSWIKDYYPNAWGQLLNSRSRIDSSRMIDQIKSNHADNLYLAEGSVFGNILAAIPAAIVDPVSWIPVAGLGAKAIGVGKQFANVSKVVKIRAGINAIENVALTMAVEPLMRSTDLTRTDEDAKIDMIASGILGGLFPLAGAGLKRGLSKAKVSATKKILGGKTPEELIEENAEQIHQHMNNTPEKVEFWKTVEDREFGEDPNNLVPFLGHSDIDITRQARDYFIEALEAVKSGSSIIVGAGNETFVGKFIAPWLVFSPNQRLLFHESNTVKTIGKALVSTNLIGDIDSRAALEDVISMVKQLWFVRNQEMSQRIDREYLDPSVETDLPGGKKLTKDEIWTLVGDLLKLQGDDVDGTTTKIPPRVLTDTGMAEDVDPFAAIRNDQKTKDIIENIAKDQRTHQAAVYNAAIDAGFFSREADLLLDATGNSTKYHVRREVLADVDEQAFLHSIKRGIEANNEPIISRLEIFIRRRTAELRINEEEIEIRKATGKDVADLEQRKGMLKGEIEDAGTKLDEVNNGNLDSTAQTIMLNYRDADISRAGTGRSRSTSALMEIQVEIGEKYLMPFMDSNIERLNQRTEEHLIGRIAMSLENNIRHDPQRVNQRLNNISRELADLKEDLGEELPSNLTDEQLAFEGERFNEKKARYLELVDKAIDLAELNEVIIQARLLDVGKGGINDHARAKIRKAGSEDEYYESVEDVINDLSELVTKRNVDRSEVARLNKEIQEFMEPFYPGVGASRNAPGLESVDAPFIARLRRRLEISQALLNGPREWENNFNEVLRGRGYSPADKNGHMITNLKEMSEEEMGSFDYGFHVSKNGTVTIRTTLGGEPGRGAVKESKIAHGTTQKEGPEGDVFYSFDLQERLGGNGTYVVVGEKFIWIDPIELKGKKLEALEKFRDSGDLDPAQVLKSSDRIRKLKTEIKKLEEADRFEQQKAQSDGKWRKRLEDELADLEAEQARMEADLRALDKRGDPLMRDYHALNGRAMEMMADLDAAMSKFDSATDTLNRIASEIADHTHGRGGIEFGTKPHISKREEGQSEGDFIGFGSRNRQMESSRSGRRSMKKKVFAGYDQADLADQRMIGRFGQSEYEYVIRRIERSRRQAAFAHTDHAFEVAKLRRHGKDDGMDDKQIQRAGDDIAFIYDQLLGRSIGSTSLGADKTIRILKNLNYMRYMGMVLIASLSDFGNAVGTLGMARYIRTMYHYMGNPDRDNMSEFARLIGAMEMTGSDNKATKTWGAGEGNRDTLTVDGQRKNDVGGRGSGVITALDDATKSGSKAMSFYNKINILGAWNSFNKQMVTVGLEDMIVDMGIRLRLGEEVSERDLAYAQSMKFSKAELMEVGRQWELSGSNSRKTIVGRDFYLAKSEEWENAPFIFDYQAKIKGATNAIIVTPSVGSSPKVFKHPVASLLWQFKSFMAASFEMTFLPLLQRGGVYKDPNALMQVMLASMGGALTYSIYEVMNGRDPFANQSETKEDGTVVTSHWSRTMAAQALDRSGMFAAIFEINNTYERFSGIGFHKAITGITGLRSYKARSATDLLAGPTVGGINEFVMALGLIDIDWASRGEIGAGRRLAPAQNTIWAKLLLDVGPSVYDSIVSGDPYFDREGKYETQQGTFKTFQERWGG